MHWAPMVVLIVLISGVVKMVQAHYGAARADRGREVASGPPRDDAQLARIGDDLARLKDRVAVLERIATDGDRSRGLQLEREIEALRDARERARPDMGERR